MCGVLCEIRVSKTTGLIPAIPRSICQSQIVRPRPDNPLFQPIIEHASMQTLRACNSAARADIKNLALHSISHLSETVQMK